MALASQFTVRHVQSPTRASSAAGSLCGGNPGRQMVGQFLNQMHRAMPPTCTPNRDRSVFLALLEEPRQEQVDQISQPAEECREIRVRLDEGANLEIQPRPRLQYGVIVRITQKAGIEYQICFPWEA